MLLAMPENMDSNGSKLVGISVFISLQSYPTLPCTQCLQGTKEVILQGTGSAGDPPAQNHDQAWEDLSPEALQTCVLAAASSYSVFSPFYSQDFTLLCALLFGLRE